MTAAMKRLRQLRERQSTERGRMSALASADSWTEETRAEFDGLEAGTADVERELRAAERAVADEDTEARARGADLPDVAPEQRERIELRAKASVGRYLTAALRGRAPDGAEAELQQAAGVDGVPFELWQAPERRQT